MVSGESSILGRGRHRGVELSPVVGESSFRGGPGPGSFVPSLGYCVGSAGAGAHVHMLPCCRGGRFRGVPDTGDVSSVSGSFVAWGSPATVASVFGVLRREWFWRVGGPVPDALFLGPVCVSVVVGGEPATRATVFGMLLRVLSLCWRAAGPVAGALFGPVDASGDLSVVNSGVPGSCVSVAPIPLPWPVILAFIGANL